MSNKDMKLDEITEKMKEADAVLIGASNGLSITEGLYLFADNQEFRDLFGDLKEKYGLQCLLHGMVGSWPSEEEKWGFWSRMIHRYCGEYKETPVMADLKRIVGEKDYFIVTSNGECHFEMCGFDPDKIFEIEGTWLTAQCVSRCHDTVYPSFEMTEKMAAAESGGRIPSHMVPVCPICGGPMQIHMGEGRNFIPNREAEKRMEAFLRKYRGKKLVILELGIGWRNQLIKAPLMRLAVREPKAVYITVNLGEVFIPDEIQDKSYGVNGDLAAVLKNLAGAVDLL